MKNIFFPGSHHFIQIDSINSRGEGVGRVNGWVIFVPDAIPGDHLDVKILSSKKNYSCGKIHKVIVPSPYRINPLCKYFASCGGCSFQNITYDYQLYLKNYLLKENLKKIGNIPPEIVKDLLGSERIWNYRNKVQHIVSKDKKGNFKLGFFRKNSHDVVNISDCPIQHKISNKLIQKLALLIPTMNWSVYDEKIHSGFLRYVISKTSFSKNEVLCILVTNGKKIPNHQQFLNKLTSFPELVGIVQNLNLSDSNLIMGEENITLWGKNYILEEIRGLKFKISPSSFFQVNICQVEKMYDILSDLISHLTNLNLVIDAYCGIGTFSLYMANRAKKIWGIEENPEAVKIAIENTRLNNLSNLVFSKGKVEELLYKVEENQKCDLIILDPPRKGCEKSVMEALNKMKPNHIIYISCNPSTLARDLLILKEGGYRIAQVQPIDMFPHTPHVESIAKLELG